jgi:glycerol uptake facilitator-like aquaporin
VPAYWAAQVLGGVAAALLLRASLGDVGGLGATTPSGTASQAFVWELLLSALLMLVILAVATDARAVTQLAALAIGGTVALDALFGGPITGASMNPARSLAPAIAGGPTDALWVYLTAPIVGATVAVGLYAYLAEDRARRVVGSSPP